MSTTSSATATGSPSSARVAEAHPRVRTYVKNDHLDFEVPYRHGSEARRYLPDFIVLVDDGRGDDDLLHLVVEIKGYRREDAKEKKATMDTYWVPGVNHLGTYGRWAFAEFVDVFEIQAEFDRVIEEAVSRRGLGRTGEYVGRTELRSADDDGSPDLGTGGVL